MTWRRSNGRYSITDGKVVLIVPYRRKGRSDGVQEVLDHLNSYLAKQGGRKVCAACGKAMRVDHKFYFRLDGRIEHRNCNDPANYHA